MKFIKNICIFIFLVTVVSIPVVADLSVPELNCTAPFKPARFNTEREINTFNTAVERYQSCINDFVDDQNEQAERHQKAASDAVNTWNRFVFTELNQ